LGVNTLCTLALPKKRDCPDFCVNKNGTVPFAAHYATFVIINTIILTASKKTVWRDEKNRPYNTNMSYLSQNIFIYMYRDGMRAYGYSFLQSSAHRNCTIKNNNYSLQNNFTFILIAFNRRKSILLIFDSMQTKDLTRNEICVSYALDSGQDLILPRSTLKVSEWDT
jgi:hypothetical protein